MICPVRARAAFQAVLGAYPVHDPNVGGERSGMIHRPVKVPDAFKAPAAPGCFTLHEWRIRYESNVHGPKALAPFSRRASTPMRVSRSGGEQMTRTSHPDGCPSFSKRARSLTALLSKFTGGATGVRSQIVGLKVRYSLHLSYSPKKLEPHVGIEPTYHRYERRASPCMLVRQIGAQHRNRTCYFSGTNRAHRQQCLRGKLEPVDGIEPSLHPYQRRVLPLALYRHIGTAVRS